ncbi:MAG: VWA domain-containing protein [Pyrinomonadaceae bacterium]
MRKIAAVFLFLSLSILVAYPLLAQTRPRRVGQAARMSPPTQQQQQQPSSAERAPIQQRSNTSRPPVLGGRTTTPNGSQSAPQNAPAPNDGPEELDENDVIRVDTTLVTIPVSVMDRDGKYIPNMRQQDFRIYEDGVEQKVAYFASVEKPFTVALLIDTSGSTRSRLEEIQQSAIAFINQLRTDDRVMIVSFDDDINVLTEATSNRMALYRAIRNVEPGDGTRVYDAVDFIINQRFNRIQGRKAIVLFTDGVDTTSRNSSYSSNIRDAEELDALIYPVQYDTSNDSYGSSWPSSKRSPGIILRWPIPFPFPGGGGRGGGSAGGSRGGGGGGPIGSNPEDYERADDYLNELARKTGARTYRGDDARNLEQSFALIAEELRRQYSLGYYPQRQALAGQRRQIAVKMNRPNLVVRARDSYISDPSASASSTQGQRSGPVLRQNKFDRTPGGNMYRTPR